MPPRGRPRRGATAGRGRNARQGRAARVADEASQHGERAEDQNPVQQEENVQQSGNQGQDPPPQNQTSNLVAELIAALTAVRNAIPTPPPPPPQPRVNPISRAMEATREFHRLNPPKFDGMASDPLVAHHWLAETRKLLKMLAITEDALRVHIVACQLTGEANEWWQSVLEGRADARRAVGVVQQEGDLDTEDFTWAEFEAKFEDQYFPHSFREQLRDQFEVLVQGTMAVSEYAIKFQSLSRFAPELVSTEERKCRRFVKGLSPSVKTLVMTVKNERFADVLELARNLEAELEEQKRIRRGESRPVTSTVSAPPGGYSNQNRKRFRDSYQSAPSRSANRGSSYSGTGGSTARPGVICHGCGQVGHYRSHCPQGRAMPPPPAQRVQGSTACFSCGGFGHVARNCPQQNGARSETASVQQPRQGQSFVRQQPRGSQSQPHYRQTTAA